MTTVFMSSCFDIIHDEKTLRLNFETTFLNIKSDYLLLTEDDNFKKVEHNLCNKLGRKYIKLPKTVNYEKNINHRNN